jgi:hypothetical protein
LAGAIFTTLEDGIRVNANLYDAKIDVYLDGGPGPNAPQHAAGLPDGNYFFQVTDPSGKTLLSSDPVNCREVRVAYGIIVEYVSDGRTYTSKGHTVDCNMDGKANATHDTGIDIDHGALTIQLMPYDNTPNRGGVYKAWMTPTSKFDGDPSKVDNPCGNGCFHGFVPADSKTDNFKVKTHGNFVAPTLTVLKFEDLDGDGVWDAGEPQIGVDRMIDGGGWPVSVTDPNGIVSNGFSPYFYYPGFAGGYLVAEDSVSGWSQTALIVDGAPMVVSASTTVAVSYTSGETHNVTYGNFECFEISGYKVNDANGDGDWDDGELGVEGWSIEIYHAGTLVATVTTGSDGSFRYEACAGGTWEVREVPASGWTITGPTSYTHTGTSGQDWNGSVFLNFKHMRTPPGRHTGFKVNDLNGNGVWDDGEPTIAGWTIYLFRNGDLYATFVTDEDGAFDFVITEGGTYEIREPSVDGWITTGLPPAFEGLSGGTIPDLIVLNFQLGTICGFKFNDANHDGVWQSPEATIAGITIELYLDGDLVATIETDQGGSYCFEGLTAGSYEVREVLPDGDSSHVWAQTFPGGDGDWDIVVTSGVVIEDANFGNACEYVNGLTWGYWKTHTGFDSPPRDAAYDTLEDNPMAVDVQTPDGDYEVDTDAEAQWVFEGAGSGESPNCSGDCLSLFRAQLLALYMNTLKWSDFGEQVYYNGDDPWSGSTVDEIVAAAIDALVNGIDGGDYTEFMGTLDAINNNGHADAGSHVLVCA